MKQKIQEEIKLSLETNYKYMKKILLFLLLSVSLFAFEIDDNLRLRSFATIDATVSTSSNARDTLLNGENTLLPEDKLNYNYSSIGAQLELDITDDIDFMTQVIYSREKENENYQLSLEWLMFSYNFLDDYKFRIGKMKVPAMQGTETRNINYSFLWTRPMVQDKGINGFNNMYGVDLIKRAYIDDVDFEYQLTIGEAEHTLGLDENNYLYNLSALVSYEASWLRLSFGQTSFDHYGRRGELLAKDEILTFFSAETKLVYNSWLLQAGYSNTENDEIPDTQFMYTSLAYEFNSITPYLLFSKTKVVDMPILSAHPAPGPPAPPAPDGYITENSYSAGIRYDFRNNFALKAQYFYEEHKSNSAPEGSVKSSANIYRLTLDMVF